jgi:hypothetical protein
MSEIEWTTITPERCADLLSTYWHNTAEVMETMKTTPDPIVRTPWRLFRWNAQAETFETWLVE